MDTPSTKDVTAVELYIITCLGLVFAAMIEFAVIIMVPIMQKTSTRDNVEKHPKYMTWKRRRWGKILNKNIKPNNQAPDTTVGKLIFQAETKQKRLDHTAFIVSSALFICFNLMYWIYYLVRFDSI